MTEPEAAPVLGRRTVGAGASLSTASQVVVALAGGLLGILIARTLGAGDTGAFLLLLNALQILVLVACLGLDAGLSYYVSGGRWAPRDALWQTQVTAVVSGTTVALLAYACAWALRDSAFRGLTTTDILISFAAVPLAASWTLGAFLALTQQRYEAGTVVPAIQATAAVVLAVVLAPTLGLAGALLAVTAAHLFAALVGLTLGARRNGAPTKGWLLRAPAPLRRAAAFGSRTQAAILLQLLNQRADLFVLNAVAARSAVGNYAIAVSIVTVGHLAPRALSSVLLPRVAALDADRADRDERDMVIGKAARQSVVLVAGVGLLIAIALPLVPVVYGSEFGDAVSLGFILLPGVALLGIANILGTLIVALGRPGVLLRIAVAVTPVTLALYALLIPAFGAEGAALASTLSYIATFVPTLLAFRRTWPRASWGELVPRREDLRDYALLLSRAGARLRSSNTSS